MVPLGGLKIREGNVWTNTGCVPTDVLNNTESLERKNLPVTVVVEMGWVGVIQVAETELDVTCSLPMIAVA